MFRRTPSRVCLGPCAAVVLLFVFLNAAIYIFSLFFFYIERTRPTACIRQSCFIYLPSTRYQVVMMPFFCLYTKKPLHTGVRTGFHDVISLFVCLSAVYCLHFSHCHLISRAVRGRSPQTLRVMKWASLGKRVGLASSSAVSSWPRSPCCCVFGFALSAAGVRFFRLFFLRTHTADGMYQTALPRLPF